jgi:hypothetical protein
MKDAIALRGNNAATNDPCALCGARTDPSGGIDLMLTDADLLVCWECGVRNAPELVAAWSVVVEHMDEFEARREELKEWRANHPVVELT